MEDIYKRITNDDEFGPDDTQDSEIQKFFVGQTVFLTGSTGFLGKCLVEKLLRSCPGIKKLYLMVRPYKVSSKERIEKYFQHVIFDTLREIQPNFASKVVTIDGNLMKDKMSLSNEDKEKLINEVTIIIHNASNVKFETRTSTMLRCNVLGTKYMLDLAKQCKYLKCFAYVSTAYSHCYQRNIEEKCYPSVADLKIVQDFIDVDEQTPDGITEAAKNAVCNPWPNLYTYSKSLAESLVEETAKEVDFACIIYRPSIVISSYQDPIAGWCGNINGPAAIFLGNGLGLVHAGYGENYVSDFVPVDMCASALLALIWNVVTHRKDNIGNAMVFNYGSSTVNPITTFEFEGYVVPPGKEKPSAKMVGPHFSVYTPHLCWFIILHIFVHFIPAVIADLVLLATFRKPQAVSIFWKVTINMQKITFFWNGNWRISVCEMQKVWDSMNERDRHSFFCDLRLLDWTIYCYPYWAGLRVFMLNDPMSTLVAGKRRYALLQGTFEVVRALTYICITYYTVYYLLMVMSPLTTYALRKLCDTYC